MALSLAIYVVIGVLTRTSNPDQYYVAGRGVPGRYTTGWRPDPTGCRRRRSSRWAGALSAQGFAGLAYVMGWTGGYLLLAVLLGPYLRQFGAYTIPDFLGARFGGNIARVIGVIAAIACSFTYLIAQVTGVGLIVSRFIGLDFNVGVFVGLLGVLFCSVLGGMKSVTWTQVAQYIILIISYLVPVVYLSWTIFAIPIPRADLRPASAAEQRRRIEITATPRRRRRGRSGKRRPTRPTRRSRPAACRRRRSTNSRPRPRSPAAGDRASGQRDAKFGRYLTVPSGVGMWNFLALTFCLMVGTAGLPHILTRYYTTPSVRQARTSVAWSLFFIFLLYFTAPAYAAFARFTIYSKLVGSKIADLPRWITLWRRPASSAWSTRTATASCSGRTSWSGRPTSSCCRCRRSRGCRS